MSNTKSRSAGQHKIGAVSSMSGVPTPTLRGWEVRHHAFAPSKTGGKHRLYSDEDVLRATLLKRLTEQGHAISGIAKLDANALNHLLQQQISSNCNNAQKNAAAHAVSMAVIGLPLAGRIETEKFSESFADNTIKVTDIFVDIPTALGATFNDHPQLLLLRVGSLHAHVQVDIHELMQKAGFAQVIVLYGFGQETIIAAMRRSGMIVRREPISDAELADLIQAVLLVDSSKSSNKLAAGAVIPARMYSDETLFQVAGIPNTVFCECPRHVAELITQLASFEQYSQECLNKSNEDAHLHAYLSAVSGSARAMFERALERLALHEGIALDTKN